MKIIAEFNDDGDFTYRDVGMINVRVEFGTQVFNQSVCVNKKLLLDDSILEHTIDQLKYVMKNALKKPIEKTLPEMEKRFKQLDELCEQIGIHK